MIVFAQLTSTSLSCSKTSVGLAVGLQLIKSLCAFCCDVIESLKVTCFDAEHASRIQKRVRSLYGLNSTLSQKLWYCSMIQDGITVLIAAGMRSFSPLSNFKDFVPYNTSCKRDNDKMKSKK